MGMMNSAMIPALQKVETAIEKSVKPEMQEAYQKIVTAGMKMAFSKEANGAIVEGLDKSKTPIKDIAIGAVGMLLLMHKQSKGTMPQDAMVPAGMTLVLHGLDYYGKTSKAPVGNNEVDEATQIYMDALLPKLGITQDMLQKTSSQVQGVMQNPEQMQKYKAHLEGK